MKRILFVMPSFKMGGTLISLRGLLSVLTTDIYDIDVMPLSPMGAYSHLLPNCRIIKPNIWLYYLSAGLSGFDKYFHKLLFAIRAVVKGLLEYDILPFYLKVGSRLMKMEKYDFVVCYAESIVQYVCHYHAPYKITWIHCDYRRIIKKDDDVIYSGYNSIVCVSEYGKRVFDSCWPLLSDKTIAIHNILDKQYIKEMAKRTDDIDRKFDNSIFTILSIGRLDKIKQFSIIPHIASLIRKRVTTPFRWYIIGGGFIDEKTKIEKEMIKYDVKDCVILLGEKENVYPYLAKCNLYVNTSQSEAYSLVNNEAKALGKPVVTNNFECVYETICDGKDGSITTLDDMPFVISNYILGTFNYQVGDIDNAKSVTMINKIFNNRPVG